MPIVSSIGSEEKVRYRGDAAVVPLPVPAPRGQVQRVAWPPVDALPVDFGPALAGHDEHHRVPGVPVHRAGDARVDLVDVGVHRAGGPPAVRADVQARAQPAARLVHLDVLERDDGTMVVPPVLDELRAALLLHVVVGDLGRGLGAQTAASLAT
jgi:hypothetical protein